MLTESYIFLYSDTKILLFTYSRELLAIHYVLKATVIVFDVYHFTFVNIKFQMPLSVQHENRSTYDCTNSLPSVVVIFRGIVLPYFFLFYKWAHHWYCHVLRREWHQAQILEARRFWPRASSTKYRLEKLVSVQRGSPKLSYECFH